MMPHVGSSTYDIVYDRQSPNAGTIKMSRKVASGNMKKVDLEHTNLILKLRFHMYSYIPKYDIAITCDLKHFR